jgi:hypothetical protein
MEEKKLTDEEIVKDIERSTGMPSYWKAIVLDLIHRLQAENAEYKQKLDDGELVSKDWHDEQVGHLQAENDRLNDMKFTQEHCDLYKENEWLKAELKRELAEHEEFTQKAKAEIESLKCNSYKTSWKAKFLEAKKENAELQKQVDELKKTIAIKEGYIDRVESEVVEWQFATKKAVKDTAKEIFTELLKDENVHINVRLDQWGETYNVACVDFDTIKELAKERYGVEVK